MTQDTNNIKIFDTTMRDGEQSPGASMNIEEKIKIAQALETLGVDIIEAGFPAASKGDFNAVKEISSIIKKSQVCALSSAWARHRRAPHTQEWLVRPGSGCLQGAVVC